MVGATGKPGACLLRNRAAYLDEDDVRVRAGKGSRPRTRRRPAHESAPEGFILTVDRGRYGCLVDDGAAGRVVTAMKARELGRNSVVVGDRVALAGDTSGATGSLARIVRVEERASVLRRSPDDTDPAERIVVANAQQLLIVCALADPEPKTRFIDRCLVAAYDAGLDPVLVLTKSDLAAPPPGGALRFPGEPPPDPRARTPRGVPDGKPSVWSTRRKLRALYAPLGFPMLTTRQPLPAVTLSRLRKALAGKVSVLIGQSGVGKSTLVNELIPDADRAVGHVNEVTGKGRHTSSSAVALRLPSWGDAPRGVPSPAGSGWLIDTPGLRGFGLGHVSPQRVVEAFGDLAEGTADCPSGCDHLSPDCALDEWAAGHGAAARLDSLRRLLRSRESAE